MFCPNCGEKILIDNAKFCLQCGYQIPNLSVNGDIYHEEDNLTENIESSEEVGQADIQTDIALPVPEGTEKDYEVIPLISDAGEDVIYKVPLFDRERRLHYQAYIHQAEYVLPLARYEIKFRKDCIVYSNLYSYLGGVRVTALSELEQYYQTNVKNMEDWIGKAIPKVIEIVGWMQKKAEKLLIASQIYGYDADTLGRNIDMNCFSERIELVVTRYVGVCEKEEQTKVLRELTRSSSSGRFIGGGFGFSGALGGMMAAGIANAGAGLARGMKSGITAIGDGMRASANKRAVFQNPENYAVLKDMIEYETDCLLNICRRIMNKETGHYHSVYDDWDKSKMLVTHAEEYSQNEDEFWKDIIRAIESCPYNRKVYETVYTRYYKDMVLISQLREIYKLFLLDNHDKKIEALYENEMQQALQMPEGTSIEVEQKIKCVKDKALEFQLDKTDELARLEIVLSDLLKKESEKKKYLQLLEKNKEVAEHVEYAMQKRDLKTIFRMMEENSMIAEERYISYYIKKIKDEENMKLYNSIAANAVKHRAYLCIVGVCSYHGWGTEENMEIANHCIVKSSEMNCSYAKAFIGMIYMKGLPEIVDKTQAKRYIEELTAVASPMMLFYYGKALSSGAQKGGSNFIKNDYEKAVVYLKYAMDCYVAGAKESYDDVINRGEEKVNAEDYI